MGQRATPRSWIGMEQELTGRASYRPQSHGGRWTQGRSESRAVAGDRPRARGSGDPHAPTACASTSQGLLGGGGPPPKPCHARGLMPRTGSGSPAGGPDRAGRLEASLPSAAGAESGAEPGAEGRGQDRGRGQSVSSKPRGSGPRRAAPPGGGGCGACLQREVERGVLPLCAP